jgi:peptide/nickel transport system substrate-binding protein
MPLLHPETPYVVQARMKQPATSFMSHFKTLWNIGIVFLLCAVCFALVGILAVSRGMLRKQTHMAAPVQRRVLPYMPAKASLTYGHSRLNDEEVLVSPYPVGHFGGTLYQASLGDGPKTLNGWASFDASSSAIASMLSCQPVQTHAHTGEIVPWVAKAYTLSPDKTRIRLTFREGLRWSDGHPLTVDDLLFTWNTIIQKGLGNPSTRDILLVNGQFPTMVKIDAHTVEVRTPEPYSPLLLNMGQSIAPRHIFEPLLKKEGLTAFGSFWTTQQAQAHPEQFVSCGPWVLHRFDPKERIIFKRNPHYFVVNARHQRLPYLDQEVITFAKDASHLQLLFEQGALHTHSADGENLGRMLRLKRPDFTLMDLGAADSTTFLAFNLNPRRNAKGQPIVPVHVQRWFQDVRFRQALNHAIDRERLVTTILKGLGQPLNTAFGANSIYLNNEIAQLKPYHLKQARELLHSAGFHWNSQGELLDATGMRVAFAMTTNAGNTQREDTLVQLQHAFSALGIKTSVQPVEFNTLVDRMKTGQWQTMVMGLSGGSNLEPQQSANVFKSDAALHLFNQREPGQPVTDRYAFEKKVDALYDAGTRVFDPAEREPVYHEIQQILYEEAPMLYLYSPKIILATRKELQNVDITPLGGSLHNIESIYLTP